MTTLVLYSSIYRAAAGRPIDQLQLATSHGWMVVQVVGGHTEKKGES